MQYIFLSHDVDWSSSGPSREHIMARQDRFDELTLRNIDNHNPYDNIQEYITIEERFGLRSTFFFRTIYEGGEFTEYENVIRILIDGGWEIGLHCDPSSVANFNSLYTEKIKLETLTKSRIAANRSHNLAYSNDLLTILNNLGFTYDSSLRKTVDKIDTREMGYLLQEGIIEFPVTIMDAYLFTYMHVPEDKILNIIKQTLDKGRKMNNFLNVITILWHSNVLKMKGGRRYQEILEYLFYQDDVKIVKGIELANILLTNLDSHQLNAIFCKRF